MSKYIEALSSLITLNIEDKDLRSFTKNTNILLEHECDGFYQERILDVHVDKLILLSIQRCFSAGAISLLDKRPLVTRMPDYRNQSVSAHDHETLRHLSKSYGKINPPEFNKLYLTYLMTSRKDNRMNTFKAFISLCTLPDDRKTFSFNDIIERLLISNSYEELTYLVENEYNFPIDCLHDVLSHNNYSFCKNHFTVDPCSIPSSNILFLECVMKKRWEDLDCNQKRYLLKTKLANKNITVLKFIEMCEDKFKNTCLTLLA